MDFQELIRTRRSVRSYSDRDVPERILARVLEAARIAPSGNNAQPWHYVVVRDPAVRQKIARASFNQMFIAEAPVVVVLCGKRYPSRYSWLGENVYLVDVTISFDHLVLAARNEGLGTCWIGAFDHDAVRGILSVPREYDAIVLTPLGYPASESAFGPPGNRMSLQRMVSYESF